jgi:RNA polymerase sigma-70 factor (ECF subfamily)
MAGLSYNLMSQDEDGPVIASDSDSTGDESASGKDDLLETGAQTLHLLHEPPHLLEEEKEDIELENTRLTSREEVTALYADYYPRIYRYLKSMWLSHDDVEELAQEAFLRLVVQLDQGLVIEKPRGWVLRVAYHLALKHQMRRARRRGNDLEEQVVLAIEQIDLSPNQEARYLQEERIQGLMKALQNERAENRECFLMRTQGLRYKDIAKIMNISEQRAAMVVKKVAMRLAVICE